MLHQFKSSTQLKSSVTVSPSTNAFSKISILNKRQREGTIKIGKSRGTDNVEFHIKDEEKQNKRTTQKTIQKIGNTDHQSGNNLIGDGGRKRERISMIHINTSQYSHIFLSNELKLKEYVCYNKKLTALFKTKIGLSYKECCHYISSDM